MKKHAFHIAFALGALAVLWVAAAVASRHALVLVMTAVIGAVYVYGALELRRYRSHTAQLAQALAEVPTPLTSLEGWLGTVPAGLQHAVRQRIEGERMALPGPALTPYLVGLLVMLGMLGTFLGMVVTLNGAVFALEGSSSVQGMRTAFSEPIKGLGLAFGTSVAGVATSAMLGLMSSLSRRERGLAGQTLDALIDTALRPFSQAHQRLETFQALQQQSQALPLVVAQLQSMMAQMAQHSQQLADRLQASQNHFHNETRTVYDTLARSVNESLRSSLSQSMQVASESIRPVVQATLTDMAEQTRSQHERMVASTREQLDALQQQFSSSASAVARTWSDALAQHEQAHTRLLGGLDHSLQQFNAGFDQRSTALVGEWRSAWSEQQALQGQADSQRQQAWQTSLDALATALQTRWQTAGEHTLALQQQICESLATTAEQIRTDSQAHSTQTLAEITRLLAESEALVRARIASETEWTAQHAQRSQALSTLLRDELSTLRMQEAERGDAAVARLTELQDTVTTHLSRLGIALEAPIARLIETASEAPKAAAEVIGQLRQEISVSVARDNALLEERTRILGTLSTLLDAINHASSEQRGVIDALVASSQTTLHETGQAFQAHVSAETGKLGEVAAQVTASAVDVASLGEALGFAVRGFSETNDRLMTSLQRIETALQQSMARSDEQLAYYVTQAREIIDLSIGSQKDVLEALQQRQTQGAA